MSAALFEIINGRFADGTPTATLEGHEARIRSIHDHLQRLLNARYDVLAHLPEHGLPDMPSLYDGLPYAVTELEDLVRRAIERFEPRLKYVQVSARQSQGSDCVVQLEVSGVVPDGGMARFRTYFQSDGAANIKQGVSNARVF